MTAVKVEFEPIERDADSQTISARVSGVADQPFRLWYRIPANHKVDDLARTHAFAVSTINQAMAVGRDLVLDGPLTHGLLANLDEYQRVWTTWMPEKFRRVELRPRELIDDEAFRHDRGAAVAYSGGLDSNFTAMELAKSNKLAALVTIHGLEFPLSNARAWTGHSAVLGRAARALNARLLFAATNWEEIAHHLPGYLGFFPATIAVPLLLSRSYGYAAVPSSYAYDGLTFPLETNPISDPMLGRPGFPTRPHGTWARRIDKVKAIAALPEIAENMRTCEVVTPDGKPCGNCRKCIPTAILFRALGLPVPQVLGGQPPAVANIEQVVMTAYALTAYKEAIAAAEQRGTDEPWLAAVKRRVAEYRQQPSAVVEVIRLKRQVGWLLAEGPRTAFGRYARRISRTLRGRTAPNDLPPISRWPYSAAAVGADKFALSAGGQRLYVDPDDRRGDLLIDEKAAPFPYSLRIWRKLVASAPWTHIVDVGANYGEMVIDTAFPSGARVFAAEPNPFVRPHLERTLREARLPVEVVAKAISDKNGNVELVLDRTWSGLTSVAVSSPGHSDHRLERIAVEATTLRALLDDGAPNGGKRVLVKIDVEGHEAAVLRGLGGDEKSYAEFAAMIEIVHFYERRLCATLVRVRDRAARSGYGRLRAGDRAHSEEHFRLAGKREILPPRCGAAPARRAIRQINLLKYFAFCSKEPS